MWEDLSPAELKLRFKNAIYRMRHAIGSEAVLFQDNYYQFNRSLDYEYDVQNFLAASSQAREEKDIEKQILSFLNSIEWYKGLYLPDIDEIWVIPDRQKYQEMYNKNILDLTRLLISKQKFEEGLIYCQKALDVDPCNEEVHRMSMEIHAAMGNKAAIARQYKLCRKSLEEEIRALPSDTTVELYEKLMVKNVFITPKK